MDKLECYLDQVCRGIGGPRSLRLHVRQELREHLLDAAVGHRAAGLSEEEALARALEDFGGAEQVRSELEATHGHCMMGVVIDKAMQWKEKTMKAKWLWTTWVHITLVIVVAGELLSIAFASTYLTPRFERLLRDGLIDPAILDETGMAWMASFLVSMRDSGGYTIWILLLTASGWGLFEWRVRSENKSFMRLSALGTASVGLLVLAALTAGSLVIPYQLSAPAGGRRVARLFALDQIAKIDTSVGAIDQALAKKDWEALKEHTDRAAQVMDTLAKAAPAVGTLTPMYEPPELKELQAQLKSANESLLEARKAGQEKDAERLKAAMQKFHELYGPIAKAASKALR